MGIVSFCPRGHRMKVKDHLAGKKGICPTCGERFRIPLATPTAGRASAAAGLPEARLVSLEPGAAATLPEVLMLAESGSPAPTRVLPPTRAPAPNGPERVDVDPAMTVAPATDDSGDVPAAIAEAAEASWCIAVPGGTASAAMSGPALLAWLLSGQATGGELVWRSDWSDWQPLARVFPDHVPRR